MQYVLLSLWNAIKTATHCQPKFSSGRKSPFGEDILFLWHLCPIILTWPIENRGQGCDNIYIISSQPCQVASFNNSHCHALPFDKNLAQFHLKFFVEKSVIFFSTSFGWISDVLNWRTIWAALREKIPNVLSRCHTKRRMDGFLLLVWHRLFRSFFFFFWKKKFCFVFFWSRCDTKIRIEGVPLHTFFGMKNTQEI